MTGLDWVIVGLITLLALFGWGQGLIAGALSLAGFALGAWLGTRIGPALLPDGARAPQAPLFGLMGAILAGSVLAGTFEGIGGALRARLLPRALAPVDGLLGAVLIGTVGLGVAWLLGAIALHNGGREVRREVQRSSILSAVYDVLPPSSGLLNALARFDPFPRIDGPSADVPAPRGAILRDPDVRAARPSVVKILGTACGLGVSGSGWVARPGVVVTNAHVVAGQDDTQVDGLPARAVLVDDRNDLAILRVDGLDAPALSLAGSADRGTPAAVLGFPENGPFDARAARIGVTQSVISQDAYGRGPVRRSMTAFRGLVRQGNSGGPLVDGAGRVAGTVFAARTGGRRGGYAVPNSVVERALRRELGRTVSTGPCA